MNEKMKKLFAAMVTRTHEDTLYDAFWETGDILHIECVGLNEDDEYVDRCRDAFEEAFQKFFGISWREAEQYRIY